MLKQLIVENYKSIRQATIDLEGINVFVGANGSGKSNLLSLFELLKALYEQRLGTYVLQRGGMERMLYQGLKGSSRMCFLFNFDDLNAFSMSLAPSDGRRPIIERTTHYFNGLQDHSRRYDHWHKVDWDNGAEESRIRELQGGRGDYVKDFLTSFTVYHFHDSSRTAPMRQACKIKDNAYLRHDASNLPAFLYRLQEQAPQAFMMIEHTLRSIAPYFKRFVLAPDQLQPEDITLAWEEEASDMYLDAHSFSDGTIRFLALATLLLQPEPPQTIVIDEPELGLHPAALSKLGALLRVAACGGTQLLVATQSVELLSELQAEDVLVVERGEKGTCFRRLDSQRLSSWLEEYSLGDLWLKNVIGGRP